MVRALRGKNLTEEEYKHYGKLIERLLVEGEHKLSHNQLATLLGLSRDQIRRIHKRFSITPAYSQGQPGRPRVRPLRIGGTSTCGTCGSPGVPIESPGVLSKHTRLGPKRNGIAQAIDCPGRTMKRTT